MRLKLNQLKQEKIFLKPSKGQAFKKVKKVSRQGLLCSGSHLIERDSRKMNGWIMPKPVDSKLLMDKLDVRYASYGPERKYLLDYSKITSNQRVILLDYNKINFNQRDYSNFLKSGLGTISMPVTDPIRPDTDAPPEYKPGAFWYDGRETTKRPRLDSDQSVKMIDTTEAEIPKKLKQQESLS